MKTVELELVTYNKPEVINTSVYFLRCFSIYSGIFGVEQWGRKLVDLAEIIKQQQSRQMILKAEGIEVTFSGFSQVIPVVKGETIIYQSREPRFTTIDYVLDVSPPSRTRVMKVTREILEEMVKCYSMRAEKDPPTLIFPKENYAEKITRAEATLLT